MIDWNRCVLPPRQHQKDGVQALLAKPVFMIADEVGAGKTKQCIDAAQIFFESRTIDSVLVVAPAAARGVWADPDLGEIAKHSWRDVPYLCRQYSVLFDDMTKMEGLHGSAVDVKLPFLRWVITNYEFVRRADRRKHLMQWLKRRNFWLICDESWCLKDHNTEQWKAVHEIRQMSARVTIVESIARPPSLRGACLRVTLLNGTPIADSPMDINAQMQMLDEKILGFEYTNAKGKKVWSCADSRFRNYYAGLAVNPTQQQMIMWRNQPASQQWQRLEELREKVAPYVIRRKTRDCFDLPPTLEPVLLEAKLKPETWKIYKGMRDDMLAWLSTSEASQAGQAIVKGIRLAQITSGFLGGVQTMDLNEDFEARFCSCSPETGTCDFHQRDVTSTPAAPTIKEIGREKLDAMLDWLSRIEQPDRILIWARFRAEIERTARAFDGSEPWLRRKMHLLYGEQKKAARQAAVDALNPALHPEGLVGVVGSAQAGGAALNLAGASLAISLSQDFNLRIYLQKNGRIDRPGQTQPIRYVDVVATGPSGQRTIDHHVLAALRTKEDIANWTTATWRKKLEEE